MRRKVSGQPCAEVQPPAGRQVDGHPVGLEAHDGAPAVAGRCPETPGRCPPSRDGTDVGRCDGVTRVACGTPVRVRRGDVPDSEDPVSSGYLQGLGHPDEATFIEPFVGKEIRIGPHAARGPDDDVCGKGGRARGEVQGPGHRSFGRRWGRDCGPSEVESDPEFPGWDEREAWTGLA